MQFAFAPERVDEFSPCACWQLLEFEIVPEHTDGILHLSVLTNLAPECADNLCSLHLHLCVSTGFAPKRADEVSP